MKRTRAHVVDSAANVLASANVAGGARATAQATIAVTDAAALKTIQMFSAANRSAATSKLLARFHSRVAAPSAQIAHSIGAGNALSALSRSRPRNTHTAPSNPTNAASKALLTSSGRMRAWSRAPRNTLLEVKPRLATCAMIAAAVVTVKYCPRPAGPRARAEAIPVTRPAARMQTRANIVPDTLPSRSPSVVKRAPSLAGLGGADDEIPATEPEPALQLLRRERAHQPR